MFGVNTVYGQTELGSPTTAYADAFEVLGLQHVRFPGGQGDIDPTQPGADGLLPVDGRDWLNITTLQDGALRPELRAFLDWSSGRGAFAAEGPKAMVTLIIPTKHLSVDDYAAFAADIRIFVETVMQEYGAHIEAFEIGNEHWEMGETAYGQKASIAAEAIEDGLQAAGLSPSDQPAILVQMATPGNTGSEFQALEVNDNYLDRITAANQQIINQLSFEARDAIDGVVEHYYFNKPSLTFTGNSSEANFINKDFEVWSDAFAKTLDIHITEWNVKRTATDQHGIAAGSVLLEQFETMIALGVDAAHIWAMDYHSRTALTLDTDKGPVFDAEGRLLNSIPGAVFDLMSDSLIGKTLLATSFSNDTDAVEINAYGSASELVFYISSRSFDSMDVTLDLSGFIRSATSITGVQISIDPASSNGRQWENGEAAKSVEINGAPYSYNEHDVDALLTDLEFSNASNIALTLLPFEIVELTVTVDTPALLLRADQAGAVLGLSASGATGEPKTDSDTGTFGLVEMLGIGRDFDTFDFI
jgi:hypothetical protein